MITRFIFILIGKVCLQKYRNNIWRHLNWIPIDFFTGSFYVEVHKSHLKVQEIKSTHDLHLRTNSGDDSIIIFQVRSHYNNSFVKYTYYFLGSMRRDIFANLHYTKSCSMYTYLHIVVWISFQRSSVIRVAVLITRYHDSSLLHGSFIVLMNTLFKASM